MKKLIAVATAALIFVACTTTQQRTAVNTIGTVEATATSAVDSYYTLVIQGTVSTNGVPMVSKAYTDFQAAVKVAVDATQFNTNALAPGNLVIEAQDIVNLITQLKGGK